jgi:hypothetical protein
MKALASYWGKNYDWRKCEAKLNSYPQFVTNIDGLDIHFIHVRSKSPNALPVIVSAEELGRAGVSQTHPLQQARQRRTLRGVGTAETLL